jgi:hypothetical protein
MKKAFGGFIDMAHRTGRTDLLGRKSSDLTLTVDILPGFFAI